MKVSINMKTNLIGGKMSKGAQIGIIVGVLF